MHGIKSSCCCHQTNNKSQLFMARMNLWFRLTAIVCLVLIISGHVWLGVSEHWQSYRANVNSTEAENLTALSYLDSLHKSMLNKIKNDTSYRINNKKGVKDEV